MFSNRKKITFDVVGELSVYKFEQLCVRSRNDIMALRVLKCQGVKIWFLFISFPDQI